MKILVNFSLENNYFFIYVVLTIHKDSFQEVSFVVFNNVPPFWFSKWGEHILHTLITYSYFNILYSKMCSICGGDFRNHFSVYGLYVMPTHW